MMKIKTLHRLVYKVLSAMLLASLSLHAGAATILLTNDDGLTSNILALYAALKKDGHDVIVSIPCQGQSGMGGAILFLRPLAPLTEACLNNAGAPGDPAVGPVTRKDEHFSYDDFYYVNGTPIMATTYGLEVLAAKRWGAPPDLVLSGPNEGRNTGPVINSSGTVSNAQFAAAQGVPAIALSAGTNTASREKGGANIADNPLSFVVAELSATLVSTLVKSTDTGPLLPERLALNVNFPDEVTPDTPWQLTRIGTYNEYKLGFSEDLSQDPLAQAYGAGKQPYPGLTVAVNPVPPREDQLNDEAHVAKSAVAVSVMQVSFGVEPLEQPWLQSLLGELLD